MTSETTGRPAGMMARQQAVAVLGMVAGTLLNANTTSHSSGRQQLHAKSTLPDMQDAASWMLHVEAHTFFVYAVHHSHQPALGFRLGILVLSHGFNQAGVLGYAAKLDLRLGLHCRNRTAAGHG